MNMVLLTGRDALECVNSEQFQAKWKTLYDCCPWATACQHPDFVAPWYRLYHSMFLPVLIMEESGGGSLAGLLPLALRRHGTKLTGAGDQQAEYQGWIQAPDNDSRFIVSAIRKIRAQFPGVDLCLKYLAPGIPLDWFNEKGSYSEFCSMRSHRRPIMRIDADAMNRQRSKKSNRQNYNRLRKLGDVQFERVVEHDRFIQVFDDIRMQYDFRQAALYRSMPFSDDPAKKRFCLELHKRGVLHTTVLTVGGEIAASHMGLLSKEGVVHLGINPHDPALAPHSPGSLFLAMFGVYLATENISMLDLTPGGDEYKDYFATEHDRVFELTIYSDSKRRLRTEALLSVINFSKTRLQRAGYRPADMSAAVEKLKSLRLSGLRELLANLRARLNSRRCDFRYGGNPRAVITSKLSISKNRLHDVLKFDSHGSSVRYCEFLGIVMKRMERSNHLYTFVQNETLRLFCWVRKCSAEPTLEGTPQVPVPAGDSFVLFDLYVHRQVENSDVVRCFIEKILFELKEHNSAADIYYRGALTTDLQTVVKACGFIDEQ